MTKQQYSDPVVEFIKRRFKVDCDWKTGNCYYFALILKDRFKGGQIIYDQIPAHFMYLYKGKAYDFYGEQPVPNHYWIWDELEKSDSSLYNRLIECCLK